MTLDEAIKHAEEVAEENEKSLRGWKECINRGTVGWSDFDKEKVDTSITRCSKCAVEHRQLAEWLKELKQLREQTRWIPVSEKLPDKEGYYLCSVRYMYPPYNFFEPEKVKYMDDVTIQKFDGEFNIEVKAWMSLPPCYKPQESED